MLAKSFSTQPRASLMMELNMSGESGLVMRPAGVSSLRFYQIAKALPMEKRNNTFSSEWWLIERQDVVDTISSLFIGTTPSILILLLSIHTLILSA